MEKLKAPVKRVLPCILVSFLGFCMAVALFGLLGLSLLWVLGCVSGLLVGLPMYTFLCTWRRIALF
jgi:hypothetical protein